MEGVHLRSVILKAFKADHLWCAVQVVDGNWGIHVIIPKWPFSNDSSPYAPVVFPGSSKPADIYLLTAL